MTDISTASSLRGKGADLNVPLVDLRGLPAGYSSENIRKYASPNPLVQRALHGFLLKVEGLVERSAPRTILDVGCGEGLIGSYLRGQRGGGRGHRYVGVDRSWHALKAAERLNPDADFFCTEMPSLGLRDRSVDLVLCLEVLEHVEDPAAALEELRRVASRWCLISVPHEPFFRLANLLRGKYLQRWGNHPEHLSRWGHDSFRVLLSRFFHVKELHRPFPWLLALCEPKMLAGGGDDRADR
jgi:SAM-dependent methyltransferase